MSCSGENCSDIMCDTYIDDVGYVCSDCQREFKEYLEKENKSPKTEGQIKKELKVFMDTEKDYYTEGKEIAIDEFFSSNTR